MGHGIVFLSGISSVTDDLPLSVVVTIVVVEVHAITVSTVRHCAKFARRISIGF
jgi:hypothetical protein